MYFFKLWNYLIEEFFKYLSSLRIYIINDISLNLNYSRIKFEEKKSSFFYHSVSYYILFILKVSLFVALKIFVNL